MIKATITNGITNTLHAGFLLTYFILATRQYFKHRELRDTINFPGLIVSFFLLIFIMKLMAVYVHVFPFGPHAANTWIGITMGFVFANYIILEIFAFSDGYRFFIMLFTLLCATLFLIYDQNFIYIAIMIIVSNIIFAIFSSKLLRYGFIMIIVSNLVWIGLRSIASYYLGHELTVDYRYDNDVYHLLLIISTFMLYKGFVKGLWLKKT